MRGRRLAAAAVCCLLLCGCAGREPEELAVVRLAALDGNADRVSAAAFPAPAGEEEPETAEGTGATVGAACLDLTARGGTLAFLGHTEHLVLGEELARSGRLPEVLEQAVLGEHFRPDARVWIARSGAGRDWCAAAGGDSAAGALTALGTGTGSRRRCAAATAGELLGALRRSGAAMVPALSPEGTEPAGYALFVGGAFTGWVEGETARGLELLRGEACCDAVTAGGVTRSVTGVSTAVEVTEDGLTVRCVLTARCPDGRLEEGGERALEDWAASALNACLDRLGALGSDGGVLRSALRLGMLWGEEGDLPQHPEALPTRVSVTARIED